MRHPLAILFMFGSLAAAAQTTAAEAVPLSGPCTPVVVQQVVGVGGQNVGGEAVDVRRLVGLAGMGPLLPELFQRSSSALPLAVCAQGHVGAAARCR